MTSSADEATPLTNPAGAGGPPAPPFPTISGAADDPGEPAGALYRAFLKEKPQIDLVRARESAKLGRDIGFEGALARWIADGRASWLKENR